MPKPHHPAEVSERFDPNSLDWRQLRALEMLHRKLDGMPVDDIAKLYRIKRRRVYGEIASIPPEIRARLAAAPEESPC